MYLIFSFCELWLSSKVWVTFLCESCSSLSSPSPLSLSEGFNNLVILCISNKICSFTCCLASFINFLLQSILSSFPHSPVRKVFFCCSLSFPSASKFSNSFSSLARFGSSDRLILRGPIFRFILRQDRRFLKFLLQQQCMRNVWNSDSIISKS
ncbi:unnamed protein product [Moneuplotes crassus]|uniref:Uncharacterized protein n=1 Tax=Euplotes crassus TaxID=5936 RepID=A0AAD2CZ51_EUPCR|nr:unnamed protein product [Moneuplotes crassus]